MILHTVLAYCELVSVGAYLLQELLKYEWIVAVVHDYAARKRAFVFFVQQVLEVNALKTSSAYISAGDFLIMRESKFNGRYVGSWKWFRYRGGAGSSLEVTYRSGGEGALTC